MTKLTFVACVALGGAIACRGATTTDAKGNPRASVSSEHVDPCRRGAKSFKVGRVERSVPLLDLDHLETAAPLNGCVVGIKARALIPFMGCTKKLCPGIAPDFCCNRCMAGAMSFSTSGPYGLIPYENAKPFQCSEGPQCEADRRCERQPGAYDVIGRFRVVETNSFRIDVEVMERVNPPAPPPRQP
jgi:hypothetical protein